MRTVNDRTKIIYLAVLILFILTVGLFWLDFIGFINLGRTIRSYTVSEPASVLETAGDEPSLVEREEFEKEKEKLGERIEELDRREAKITENEKEIERQKEKLEEIKKGIDIEKKKVEEEKKTYSGYKKNVMDLARKIVSMRPEEAIEIMIKWEDPLVIDVLRQIDTDAADAGRISITSYLISLMPRDRASRVMYLMTQL